MYHTPRLVRSKTFKALSLLLQKYHGLEKNIRNVTLFAFCMFMMAVLVNVRSEGFLTDITFLSHCVSTV